MTAWNPRQILLLDDENSVMSALKLLLGALGFQVDGFTSAQEALTFAKNGAQADLCICDLRMPGMSGLEFLEKMKAARPELPFVLMSAHADDDEVARARALGADGFLSKPFVPSDVFALITELGKKFAREA